MTLNRKSTIEERFWSQVLKTKSNECWLWTGCRAGPTKGYGCLAFKGSSIGAHRFSYLLHHGEIPHAMEVMHKCDNGLCVNPNHLEIGTRKKNMEEAVARGRLRPYDRNGDKNHNAIISSKDVLQIRRLVEQGYTQQSIAEEFGIGQTQVSKIKLRRSWGCV